MREIKVYRNDMLSLKQNVPGAKMWAVGLDKAMLTIFEAEQITLILEGEMTFSYEGKAVVLKAGEVIAIPSNIVHAASTGGEACKAVDAWSPVRKEFL